MLGDGMKEERGVRLWEGPAELSDSRRTLPRSKDHGVCLQGVLSGWKFTGASPF